MRKQVFGRQLNRDKNQRRALFQGLISSMILGEGIKTTEQKAKSVKGDIEKLVTKAKKGIKDFDNLNPNEIERLVNNIAPRFTDRQGGYTRLVRLGRRFNDNATMVFLRWVDGPKPEVKKEEKKKVVAKKIVKAEKAKKPAPKKKTVKKEAK